MKSRVVLVNTLAAAALTAFTARAQAPVPPAVPRATTTPPAAAQRADAPPGNAVDGRKLFVSVGCYQCHGYEAQGSTATGPRLGPHPIAYASFAKYVRQPTNQMPPYTRKVLSDGDLADIHAFLRSLPEPASVDRIPLLK